MLQAFHEVALDETAHAARQRSKKLTKICKRRKGSVSDQAQPARGCPKFSNVVCPSHHSRLACGMAAWGRPWRTAGCRHSASATVGPVSLLLMCKVMQRGEWLGQCHVFFTTERAVEGSSAPGQAELLMWVRWYDSRGEVLPGPGFPCLQWASLPAYAITPADTWLRTVTLQPRPKQEMCPGIVVHNPFV